MVSDHQGKLMKSLRGAAQKFLGVGFLLGFFLVLLTYFTVSEQFAIAAPNAILGTSSPGHPSPTTPAVQEKRQQPPAVTEEKPPRAAKHAQQVQEKPLPSEDQDTHPETDAEEGHKPIDAGGGGVIAEEGAPAKKPACDIQGPWASDVCDIAGDVRIRGSEHTVLVVPPIESGGSNPNPQEWRIRPYSRKHQGGIPEVTVRELAAAGDAPPCAARSPVPALVFAMGGLTGNYWHDFSDVLIPLYLQAARFAGEVQLVAANFQPWFAGKYRKILGRLSRYEIVDMDRDEQWRCFPGAVVGIRMHKDFSIDPAKDPVGHSMPEFTKFLRGTFSLPRDAPIRLAGAGDDDKGKKKKKPRMMIISRRHPRRLMNVEEVVAAAERVGFEVVIGDPPFNVDVGEFAREVNAADALVGVHGAGLTNAVFLPTGAVFIQVVPYGKMEHIGEVDFGTPAADMGLRYMAYSAGVEESTLVDTLGRDHPAVRDPDSIHRSGWGKVAEFYLGRQDIRLDLRRFEPLLRKAMDMLAE